MPQLLLLQWDFNDRLQQTSWQVVNPGSPETTYYIYDSGGQRVRKVTERQAASGTAPARLKERLYLGSSQLYREYAGDGTTTSLERESLEIMADSKCILLIESWTKGDYGSPARLFRYQFDNLIGSAALELDDQAQLILYQEYLPYGSTSYQAIRSQLDTPKGYRFIGKEQDKESGLTFHGIRYYVSWIGRWLFPDPAGIKMDRMSSSTSLVIRPS
jgi:RHS repeat-associated protein